MAEYTESSALDFVEEDFNTVLESDIDFEGVIEFSEPMMIKGKVNGRIEATSDLLVDEGAVVTANIRASRIVIKGTVSGKVVADKIVRIFSSGRLTGNVTAPEVILDTGCFFSGICTMTKERH